MATHGESSLGPSNEVLLQRMAAGEQRALLDHNILKEQLTKRIDTLETSLAANHAENIQRSKERQDDISRSFSHLNELLESKLVTHEERFRSVALQFSAFERLVAEQHNAAQRAIAKSELVTTKQIDQIASMINTLPVAIDDVKGRIQRVESLAAGRHEAIDRLSGATRTWMSVIGTIAAVGGAIIGYAIHTHI